MEEKQKRKYKGGIVIEDYNYEILKSITELEGKEEQDLKKDIWYYWFQENGKLFLEFFPKATKFNIGEEVGISFSTVLYEKKILERDFEEDWNTIYFRIKSKRYCYDIFADDHTMLKEAGKPTIYYGIELINK